MTPLSMGGVGPLSRSYTPGSERIELRHPGHGPVGSACGDSSVPTLRACDNCERPTPVYRVTSVILDGRVAGVCTRCAASESARIEVPYAPRTDQGAIQPSTPRDTW